MLKTLAIAAGLALSVSSARAEIPNVCAAPEIVGDMLTQMNNLLAPDTKATGISWVDMTSITTLPAKPDRIKCHVTAELSNGWLMPGTYSTDANAAGEVIVRWKADPRQTWRRN